MPLKITLDEPHRVYRPGDTITGKVELRGHTGNLYLVLQGVAETKFSVTRTCRALLLHESYTLLELNEESAKEASDGEGVIPFAIPIPECTQKIDVSSTHPVKGSHPSDSWTSEKRWEGWDQHDHYQRESGHPLPPTCKFAVRRKEDWIYCLVEYCVFATCSRVRQVMAGGRGQSERISKEKKPKTRQGDINNSIIYDRQPFWMQAAPVDRPPPKHAVKTPQTLVLCYFREMLRSASLHSRRSLRAAFKSQTLLK